MREIAPIIDQLHLAGELLVEDSPIKARLSLILTDNAVELLMHRECRQMLSFDFLGDRYSQAEKRRALGRHFDEKAKFLCRKNKLSELERDFILAAHDYRNEAYHAGRLHDRFIRRLAWTYHQLACGLFSRLGIGMHSFGSRDPTSESTEAYVHILRRNGSFEKVGDALSSVRPVGIPRLAEALSEAAIVLVEEQYEALDFIAADMPGLEERTREGALEKLRQYGSPRVTLQDLSRWKMRAKRLCQEQDSFRSLLQFEGLKREMNAFAEVATETAIQLDGWISAETDRALGK